ncbi:PulJ/GspJ family protein [Desulfovibrio porci]|uniref:PulJ/GspJ family protein n=1 Tax=Desulfovibrio porci TaxID=2605782 RepID=UPI003A8CFC13
MNTSCRNRRAEAGFTLLELLIAMALTAVIGMVLFSTYSMVMNNGQSVRALVLEREGERIYRGVLDNDMAGLCRGEEGENGLPGLSRRPIVPSAEFYRQTGIEPPEPTNDEVVLSFAGGARLARESITGPDGLDGPVCVEYVLRAGGRGKALIRRERGYCGVEGDFPWAEFVLLRGLQSVDTALYISGKGWLPGWEARTEAGDFPRAVRFTLLREGETEPEVFLAPVFAWRSDEEEK